MSTPAPQRCFRYSVRMMFVLVAIFAYWLEWELHPIRERDRLIRSAEFLRLFEYRPRGDEKQRPSDPVAAGPPPQTDIPYVWRLLGDKAVEGMDIFLPSDKYTPREARRIQSLFPECAVTIIDVDQQ